ncbi:LOW QUALITY PROTEIN: BH3-like motif-containing cell death inducer [Neovison vison]|uniref:LOW QUALITY PROTEIN: BH3-like motif-containing cell death inducer n=1 Tax=Neovison vison TaxID=452646 RepID=UPI001CEFF054|nr:LOW QUALITY PROTEIN: BH3-like motif-containing cell death inducer [Neogale vison]
MALGPQNLATAKVQRRILPLNETRTEKRRLPRRSQESPFYQILETQSVPCTAWLGQASRGSIYPEAEWTLFLATKIVASFNKETKLPKETMFPLTRYNLGSSAVGWGRGGAVLGNVLQRLSYLTRIQTTLLQNSPC